LPKLIAALEGERTEREVADWFYGVEWRSSPALSRPASCAGEWIVLDDGAGVARALADAFARSGIRALVLHASEVEGLLTARDARGVVCAAALTDADETAVLALLRLLAAQGKRAPRCWLVTQGAVSTGSHDPPANPRQAAVWGLGKTFALEHPRAWGGLIDLPRGPALLGMETADRAVAWMAGPHGEDLVALRDEGDRVEEVFEYTGKFYDIPPIRVIPKPVQRPHPPIFAACTRGDTVERAGRLGIGALCFCGRQRGCAPRKRGPLPRGGARRGGGPPPEARMVRLHSARIGNTSDIDPDRPLAIPAVSFPTTFHTHPA
jgi:acyl transferase domain-containing protein